MPWYPQEGCWANDEALWSGLRWWVIAPSSDWLSVQIVRECSGWFMVIHSKACCMAAASSVNDEVNAAPRRWRMLGPAGLPQATITSVPPFSQNISLDLVSLSVISGSYCICPIIGTRATVTHLLPYIAFSQFRTQYNILTIPLC